MLSRSKLAFLLGKPMEGAMLPATLAWPAWYCVKTLPCPTGSSRVDDQVLATTARDRRSRLRRRRAATRWLLAMEFRLLWGLGAA